MVTDIGPRPRPCQHIEDSCSWFDALRKSPFLEPAKDVVMQHSTPAQTLGYSGEKHNAPFRITLAESARQREGEEEWRGESHLKKGSKCSKC